ncbi:unnamed protein product [Allacma fusca]|uniref:Uncharacterized protein n=1 Tax=Allacma fusca TaxID=39272 RepID=A0A8J2LLH6_9HEXA|nr:unnamed protein product [Allacma fusca]
MHMHKCSFPGGTSFNDLPVSGLVAVGIRIGNLLQQVNEEDLSPNEETSTEEAFIFSLKAFPLPEISSHPVFCFQKLTH